MSEKEAHTAGKTHGKQPPFTKKTPEYKFLKKMFEAGDIAPSDKPADIHHQHQSFQRFTPAQFRSQFNKLKTDCGLHTRKGRQDEVEKTSKSGAVAAKDLGDVAEDEEVDVEDNVEFCETPKSSAKHPKPAAINAAGWMPHQIGAQYENKDGVQFFTVIIALTGGTAEENLNGVHVKYDDRNNEIIVSEQWSPLLNNMDAFYKHCDKKNDIHEGDDEDFILRKIAMKKVVREMIKEHGGENGMITSVHKHWCPIRADPQSMRLSFMGTNSGCRYVHIDLTERKKAEETKVTMMNVSGGESSSPPKANNVYAPTF